jgi:hypothetical protein
MAYTDPFGGIAIATNQLITEDNMDLYWNDNIRHLYDRKARMWVPAHWTGGSGGTEAGLLGNFKVVSYSNLDASNVGVGMTFVVPSDFLSLSTAKIMTVLSTTTTVEYDVEAAYGAEGQLHTTHTGSSLNQSFAATINQIKLIDVSGILGSLAANDFVGIDFSASSGANAATWYVMGLFVEYTRS